MNDDDAESAGISAGQLQKLQGELAQMAAMAGQMALSAGWWQLASLLQALSASAQAGASSDLLPLLQVGIHAAGEQLCQ